MTVCAKCRHLRPVDTPAPAWQCPGCGIAYAKALLEVQPAGTARPLRSVRRRSTVPWRVLLIAAAVVAGVWWAHHSGTQRGLFGSLASVGQEAPSQPKA